LVHVVAADPADVVVAQTDGPARTTLTMPTVDGVPVEPYGSMAFSPDSRLVAIWGSQPIESPDDQGNPHFIEIFDVPSGAHVGSVALGGLAAGGILGWGDTGLLALIPQRDTGTSLVRFDVSDLPDVSQEIVVSAVYDPRDPEAGYIWHAAVPHAMLDADIRTAAAPDTPFDWNPVAPWILLVALVVAPVVLGVWSRAIRRKS
jgi:hypothetical protein